MYYEHRVFGWLRYLTVDRSVQVRELAWVCHQSSLIKLTVHIEKFASGDWSGLGLISIQQYSSKPLSWLHKLTVLYVLNTNVLSVPHREIWFNSRYLPTPYYQSIRAIKRNPLYQFCKLQYAWKVYIWNLQKNFYPATAAADAAHCRCLRVLV